MADASKLFPSARISETRHNQTGTNRVARQMIQRGGLSLTTNMRCGSEKKLVTNIARESPHNMTNQHGPSSLLEFPVNDTEVVHNRHTNSAGALKPLAVCFVVKNDQVKK